MDKSECEYGFECTSDKCLYCLNYSMFKDGKKSKTSKNSEFFMKQDKSKANADDSWKDLEQQVADSLNKVPNIKESRRSRASGALWFEKGDIVDEILHPECKERTAEKSFSIKREWLEKASDECKNTGKTMCLPFRFKGDDKIYCVFDNNDIATLITTMKSYMKDNELLRQEINMLREKIKKGDE